MQFPVYILVLGKPVLLHSITETLALFVGFRYFLFLRKRQGDVIESAGRTWIILGAILGAVVGSRLIGGLERPQAMLNAANKWLYFYSNKTVVGGFLGGLAGVELAKKLIGETRASGDLFVYPMILALIIGRIGCFSMGVYEETYGLPTALPWGMNLGDGRSRHPVALYEMVFLCICWLLLVQVQQRKDLANGALFKLWLMAYLLFRLLLDFIKPAEPVIWQFSAIQLTCLAGLCYYYRYLVQPGRLCRVTSLQSSTDA